MIFLEKYIDLLVQMLAIPSISRNEDTRASFLEKWLLKEGYLVKRVNNNLIITNGNEAVNASLLLNSHIDTVSPGEGWNSDPFIPVVDDKKVTGLGSNDDGASVISLIAAFEQIVKNDPSDAVVLVLSAEEEVSGKKGISSVIPLLPNLKFAIVGEPTGMQPAVAERGLMVVDAVAKGIPGHAARNEGKNAIYLAMKDIEKIQQMNFSDHSTWLKDPSANVTMISAGTEHNVTPGKCEFVIDVRSNDKYSNERLLEMLKDSCISELKPRSMRLESSFLSDAHPVFKLLNKLQLTPFGSPTLSDMALLQIPSVKMGPGNSARSHTANEFILTNEIAEAVEQYSKLITEIINIEL